MRKEATIHMLLSDKFNAPIGVGMSISNLFYVPDGDWDELEKYLIHAKLAEKPQHLYLTTDEEIKKGDYVLHPNHLNHILKVTQEFSDGFEGEMLDSKIGYGINNDKTWRKVVATTNLELWGKCRCCGAIDDHFEHCPNNEVQKSIAKIPQSFIQQYVDRQGSIKKVMLEYDEKSREDFDSEDTYPRRTIKWEVLKLNSSGEVVIFPIAKVISYKGHFHLYKEIDGEHWVAMIDHRIGPLSEKVTPEVAATFTECENNCYLESQIESFNGLTIDQLKQFENK